VPTALSIRYINGYAIITKITSKKLHKGNDEAKKIIIININNAISAMII
jgi:hypothetical protein